MDLQQKIDESTKIVGESCTIQYLGSYPAYL
jgi:hypothetical protein